MAPKPSVFIGSSSEGLSLAKAVQRLLADSSEPTIWNQGVFELTQSSLESLEKALDRFDFAVLVLTPDDTSVSRSIKRPAPRDNAIFELGLFIGRIGRKRSFFVYDRTANVKIPSDLLGITAATFTPHKDGNLLASLGPACTQIEERIQSLGSRPRFFRESNNVDTTAVPNLAGTWKGFSPDGPQPDKSNSTMQIEQHGSLIRAYVEREVREGRRTFTYDGYFSAGQIILIFEDPLGPGFIIGTMVLSLSGNLKMLAGRSTYYHHSKKEVVSTPRVYKRD